MSSTPAVAEKSNPSLDVTECTRYSHIGGGGGVQERTLKEKAL